MAASHKKRRVSENDEEEEMNDGSDSNAENDDSEEESDMDDLANTEVKVDFEAVTPDDSDFSGIKRLLGQLFLKAHVNISELTDLLLKQNYVSSVVKLSEVPEEEEDEDEEDDVFGIISVINMADKKEESCVKQIRQLLCDACEKNGTKEIHQKFTAILEDAENAVGFLISERFINIPPQIALPLYESLNKDLSEARNKKLAYNLSHFMLLCKLFKDEGTGPSPADTLVYANAEEELLAEEADLAFDFSVAGEGDTALGGKWKEGDEELKPFRRLLLIPCTKWDSVMTKLKAELAIKT